VERVAFVGNVGGDTLVDVLRCRGLVFDFECDVRVRKPTLLVLDYVSIAKRASGPALEGACDAVFVVRVEAGEGCAVARERLEADAAVESGVWLVGGAGHVQWWGRGRVVSVVPARWR